MSLVFFGKLLHGLACVALIVIVLLQADKGEGLSGAFGSGGGAAIFGKRGASGFFAKVTAGAAVVFMLTSFWLGWKGAAQTHAPRDKAVPVAPDTTSFPVQ